MSVRGDREIRNSSSSGTVAHQHSAGSASAWDLVRLTETDRREYAGLPVDLPDHYSAFENALGDALRHLWVQRPEPAPGVPSQQPGTARSPGSSDWDVYGPDGRWVTTVQLPPDLEVHDIGKDHVLGIWRDDLDVPYVRMYSLDQGGST